MASQDMIGRGGRMFAQHCYVCHGPNAVGIGTYPDLRYASEDTHKIWNAIVLSGAYASKGMPDFGAVLTADDVTAIQAYVVEQAKRIDAAE